MMTTKPKSSLDNAALCRLRRYPKGSRPTAMGFRYLHSLHRRRKVGPRRQPIPDPVQIVLQILVELLESHPVHPRRTLIGLPLPIGLPYLPLRNIKRLTWWLQLVHATPPGKPTP